MQRRPAAGEDIRVRLEDKTETSDESQDDSEVYMTTDSELEAGADEEDLAKFVELQRSEEDRFGCNRIRWKTFIKAHAIPMPHPVTPISKNRFSSFVYTRALPFPLFCSMIQRFGGRD